jgi:hypothetical protein
MASTFVTCNKYDTLIKPVTFNSEQFTVSDKTIHNELIRYSANRKWVYLNLGRVENELHQVGRISAVRGNTVCIDLLDNPYGRFVKDMIYKAVDLSVSADGLGQLTSDDRLIGFRVNNIIISNFVRWF